MDIGSVIRTIKREKNLHFYEIADILGVDRGTVSKWANGVWKPTPKHEKELLALYTECNPIPEEAPENLNEVIVMNKTKPTKVMTEPIPLNDLHDALGVPRTSTGDLVGWSTDSLEPTSFEQLNPPDISDLNQAPIDNGYALFLENLRFFMKDTRWDTDEKLEAHLTLKPGYISEFGHHRDRFEEILVVGEICDLIGIPWSVLAFSQAAKEDRLARVNFQIEQFNIVLANLQSERDALNSELAKNAGC